ncbi:hypothetical protein E3N88_08702 [Mikania micrantha]|uniref:Bifunctional inhibitor/plant lipid transfer protein/seed storage helical domain-containing protein n=1 Tax=Mikania micrantha TaxID=192012 RepID=A0A5N6PJ88_9ASTR|nr:hypothetical protein E3N88_08702 [Mikania micrantha]
MSIGATIDDNPIVRTAQSKCPKIPPQPPCHGLFMEEFTFKTRIMRYLNFQLLERCCTGLKQSTKQCLCNAIQQEYDIVRPKANPEDFVEKRRLLTLAQTLPKECGSIAGVKQCEIKGPKD